MISLWFLQFWQRLASFCPAGTNGFRATLDLCKSSYVVHTASLRCAIVCQNRYPSPSRGPDQINLVRPSSFDGQARAISAEKGTNSTFAIAYHAMFSLCAAQENARRKKTCNRTYKRSFLSRSSVLHCLGCAPVTTLSQILNVALSVLHWDVSRVKSLLTGAVLKAPSSVEQAVFLSTIYNVSKLKIDLCKVVRHHAVQPFFCGEGWANVQKDPDR